MMVVMMILHVFRGYLTGGFKKPRELTWVTDVAIAVIGSPLVELLRVNASVDRSTLTHFYCLHTVFMLMHIPTICKQGIWVLYREFNL
ncbi:hypothetical protein AMTRI_Chr01g128820 [Amborella trichopoda]